MVKWNLEIPFQPSNTRVNTNSLNLKSQIELLNDGIKFNSKLDKEEVVYLEGGGEIGFATMEVEVELTRTVSSSWCEEESPATNNLPWIEISQIQTS